MGAEVEGVENSVEYTGSTGHTKCSKDLTFCCAPIMKVRKQNFAFLPTNRVIGECVYMCACVCFCPDRTPM